MSTKIDKHRSENQRTWGIRFSLSDLCVLAFCAIVTPILGSIIGVYALIFPYILGTFFLFCNVIRIRRSFEYIWSALFVMLVSAGLLSGSIASSRTFFNHDALFWIVIVQIIFTGVLVLLEIRSPRYHGICARRINTRLDEYLGGKVD